MVPDSKTVLLTNPDFDAEFKTNLEADFSAITKAIDLSDVSANIYAFLETDFAAHSAPYFQTDVVAHEQTNSEANSKPDKNACTGANKSTCDF